MVHRIPKIPLMAAILVALAGCTRIPTGSVGIEKSFTGHISSEVVGQGLYVSLFTDYYPIDTTMTRATVKGMRPKDRHGVSLRDVSVVVTYSLDPGKVAAFYRKTKELDPEPDSNYYTLGLQILEQSVIPYAVQIATEKSDLANISSHLSDYADTIQTVINKRLNELYPGINPFIIQSVTVPEFELPQAIQAQVNAKAGYEAELQTIAAERRVIEQRKALEADRATVQADALAAAAQASGLKPDQIIEWEKARAQMMLAQKAKGVGLLLSAGSAK